MIKKILVWWTSSWIDSWMKIREKHFLEVENKESIFFLNLPSNFNIYVTGYFGLCDQST